MTALLIVGGIVLVGVIVAVLLVAITRQGGQQTGAAEDIAGQVLDQTDAHRTGSSEDPWDGVDRLKTGPGDPGFL
ncbi:MAG: hypothetical protein OEW30_19590 [Acidimicrobiia bacterium]|nr:hypothetical protein [Acidimicrobiia bacterium]